MGTEYFSLARTFRTVWGEKNGLGGKHHLIMTGWQEPSERRSCSRLKEGARRCSGGKDSPNGAYRSEGPCRHNMSYIFVISKVVFDVIKI